jgi:hypothetical protein
MASSMKNWAVEACLWKVRRFASKVYRKPASQQSGRMKTTLDLPDSLIR